MDATVHRPLHQDITVVVGPFVAVIAAWLLSLGRSGPNGAVSLANTTLIITAITLAAAVIDWRAGVATSVVAAISLNYFHTQPYRTLRITDRQDLLSVGLLAVVGLTASTVAAGRTQIAMRRASVELTHTTGGSALAQAAAGAASTRIWNSASNAIGSGLSTTTAIVEQRRPLDLPTISRDITGAHRLEVVAIPRTGAAVPLELVDGKRAWLVIRPNNPDVASQVDRRSLVLFAEAIEFCSDVDREA